MEISDNLNIIKKYIIPILKNTDFIKQNKINTLNKLDKIFFLIKKYITKISKTNYNVTANNIITYPLSLDKNDNKFVPEVITNIIFNKITIQYKFTIKINNRKINIYISDKNKIKKEKIDNILQFILTIINVFDELSSKELYNLDIFLYLTNVKKLFPKNKYDILTKTNVNSGYTSYFTNNHREIVIYREEELFKVLIHELIHYYDFDIKTTINFMENKLFIKNCLKMYGETYTDIWARILNIMFIAVKKTNNYNDYLKFFEISLYIEILFSYFQGFKTLNHFNITYEMLRSKIYKINNYKESSNGYCYYVLPSIILMNLDVFLDFCITNNKKNFIDFNNNNNNNNNNNHKSFILLILKILNSNEFKNIEQSLSKYSIKNNTMRMSIIE